MRYINLRFTYLPSYLNCRRRRSRWAAEGECR